MFDNISSRFTDLWRKLSGSDKITEENVTEAVRAIRTALLEADVSLKVAKNFTESVREKALGAEVLQGVRPGEQFVKIVHDELAELMGGKGQDLVLSGPKPISIMFVGLQGSGKTTSVGKTALFLRRKGRRPYLVPADVYRPAAIDQLKTLGAQIDMPVYDSRPGMNPRDICRLAREEAERYGHDVMLIDTAGRLSIDDAMMKELEDIKASMKPSEILFVADAMTGQEAVNVAKTFNDRVEITGVVLTKMDSDARGGAALSIKSVLGKPVKLVGVGEKMEALEPFHPDRMAGRILDMGDIMTLIERAESMMDEKAAEEMERKLRKNEFTLEDFRDQLVQLRKMGPLDQVLSMLPGMGQVKGLDTAQGEREMKRTIAIVDSMTPAERRDPSVLNGSRRKRIARGSGTGVEDVNRLLKQYVQARKMMKSLGGPGGKAMKRLAARLPQFR